MKTKRLEEMENYILTRGSASMEELRDIFHMSMNTVRRDVTELLQTGKIRKVYGGVEAMDAIRLPLQAKPEDVKRAICFRAAQMVQEGDVVYIDSGTTTEQMIEALKDKKITVVTHNIRVMMKALRYENIRVIMLPGEVRRKTLSVSDEDSAEYLSHLNTKIAFMAASGVSLNGVANSSPLEYAIKKTAVRHAEKAVLLVSGSKFGVSSLLVYAGLDAFQAVITDSRIPDAYRKRLAELRVDLQIVADDP